MSSFPQKPKGLDKMLRNHRRLIHHNSMKEIENELSTKKQEINTPNSSKNPNIMFTMIQKQIDHIKLMFFDLEDRIIKLEEK
ncbi:MAG: hypothetical protein ACFFG0_09675 [Candidatus Thorarchaeota archaeon]